VNESQNILVVDDDPRNRTLLKDYLKAMGLPCDQASDGEQCLSLMRGREYDLVLLDIMMPRMDGFEVLRLLKDSPQLRQVPVIVISALDLNDGLVRAIELGAADFLQKPFSIPLLKARVTACLERKRLLDNEKLVRERERQQYELLQDSYRRLAHTETARDNLNHMIVHDLNNPIGAVINYAELIQAQASSSRPNLAEIIRSAEQTLRVAEQMSNLTAGILDVSKFESGKMRVDPQPLDLGHFIRQSLETAKATAHANGIQLDTNLSPDLSLTVEADPHLLPRVIDNLLSNALKHARTHAHISVQPVNTSNAVLQVTNDGEPIPDSERTRIFDKYYQIDSGDRRKARRRGLGLGLSFCKMAVDAMSGRIWTDCGTGGLTHFYVELASAIEPEAE